MATRAEIRTRARIRADQNDSAFPTNTEYDYLIDEAAKEAWFDLVFSGWPINFTVLNKAVATNPITLGISGTVAFIRGVYFIEGSVYHELKRVQEGDRATLLSQSSTSRPSQYDVRIDPTNGPVLELLPQPASGTVRVEYILEHPGFAADGTAWYGPARSDELIVLRAAAKAMRKEGNDQGAAQVDREYTMLLDKVQQMAGWFNMRHSAVIRDVGDATGRGARSADGFDYDV